VTKRKNLGKSIRRHPFLERTKGKSLLSRIGALLPGVSYTRAIGTGSPLLSSLPKSEVRLRYYSQLRGEVQGRLFIRKAPVARKPILG